MVRDERVHRGMHLTSQAEKEMHSWTSRLILQDCNTISRMS